MVLVPEYFSELIVGPNRTTLPLVTSFQALWLILSFQLSPRHQSFYSKFNQSFQVPAAGFHAESQTTVSLEHAVFIHGQLP